MTKPTFATFLKWLRKELHLTQSQLAERVHCVTSTIGRVERGEQMPGVELFMKLNRIFEPFGIIYDEVWLEDIFEFRAARTELLYAIKSGRGEEIERKLDKFVAFMEDFTKENELDQEDEKEIKQYYVLGHLISIRKRGLPIEQFLDETIAIYEIRRKIPDYNEIPNMRLTQIEYQLLYEIGEARRIMGDNETAELIFKGLMANDLNARSPFIKEKYMELSFALARLCMMKNDYDSVNDCLSYIFNNYLCSHDTRTVMNSLSIQKELCAIVGDIKGVNLIDEFIKSTDNLMSHMYLVYRVGN